jgi:hypothetical protein
MALGGYTTTYIVPEWILAHADAVSQIPSAAITTIDSSRTPAISPQLGRALSRTPESSEEALLLTGSELVDLARDGHFTGYDEVWLFDGPLSETAPPVRLDCLFRAPDITAEVEAWFDRTGAIVGIGDDGEGLSYVRRSNDTAFDFGDPRIEPDLPTGLGGAP